MQLYVHEQLLWSFFPVMTESVGAQNYIAKMAYTAQLDDEVSFPKHARVEVIEKSVTGWWTVR